MRRAIGPEGPTNPSLGTEGVKSLATDLPAPFVLADAAGLDRDSDPRPSLLRHADGSPDTFGGSRRSSSVETIPTETPTIASRWWLRGTPLLLLSAVFGLVLIAGPGFTDALAPWPFLISFLLLGMPHGAMDLWVAGRLDRPRDAAGPPMLLEVASWRRAIGRFGGYVAWMGASLALVLTVPDVATLLFFVLTVCHWGLGDQWATQRCEMRLAPGWWIAAGFIAARGCLVLGPAFANDPAAAWAPFKTIASFGAGTLLPDPSGLALAGTTVFAVGVVLAVLAAIWRWRHDGPRGASLDLAEHALVASLCFVASPLFAVGCYFMFVHSWRHAVRLGTSPVLVGRAAASRPASGLLRVHVLSLPLLVPTAAICFAAAWHLEAPPSPDTVCAAMIAFFMISTLPHHLLGLKLPGQRPPSKPSLHRVAAPDPV